MSTAPAPERLTRPSTLRTLTLGEYRLTHIPDGLVQLRPTGWFPGLDAAEVRQWGDYLDADGCLVAAIGGLLVEHRGRTMLIDSGYGPRRLSAAQTHPSLGVLVGGLLLGSLAEAGVAPASVDTIAFTHLHDDHVGWAFAATDEGPLFPNAAFAVSADEWEAGGRATVPPAAHDRVRAAGDGDEVFPGITLRSRPGHTGGHAGYVLAFGGAERLLVAGDVLHSPLQVAHPHWQVFFDSDRETAVSTRTSFLEEAAAAGTLCYAGHFADVVFGRVLGGRGGHVWEPLH